MKTVEKQKIKISVVIPVYNGGEWVAQCLENILCQSYKNLEVIVIDDGSTDDTAEIAAKYPVILLRQENIGVSAARNCGIEAATGDYIHFMDVDDWINLDYYASMVEAVESTGADMAFGGFIHETLSHITRLYSDKWLVTTLEDKFRLTNAGIDGYSWRYIVRKSLLDNSGVRFEVGRAHQEDLPFSIQVVSAAEKIVTVPGATYYYRYRPSSAMRNQAPEAKRKRKENAVIVKTMQDELMRKYGLEWMTKPPVEKIQYKLLGIPILEKRVFRWGKTRWYLFGLYVAQHKKKRR